MSSDDAAAAAAAAREEHLAGLPLLREPRDGVPQPLTDDASLQRYAAALRAGNGPVALDAERASGYRYSQRAYLVQLRRDGAGTALIDPIELSDLSIVDAALAGPDEHAGGDAEWILHAANQDLPCLAELGLRPRRLFDTELAGRLLGEQRVALATMIADHLGVRIEKGHAAADWSTRPLPPDWQAYAALDVELLIELRGVLVGLLEQAGKTEWARQEFEAVRTAEPSAGRTEPWRRTSGIHRLRNRRQLAAVRALWQVRDAYAAEHDIAPGRVLPDSAVIEAARVNPARRADLVALPVFGGPRQRRRAGLWFEALAGSARLPDDELPALTAGSPDAMPTTSRWRDRDPQAAARLAGSRDAVAALADEHQVLAQNLLASEVIRKLCWTPPAALDDDAVADALTTLGARPWQTGLTAGPLAAALREVGVAPAGRPDTPAASG